MCASSYLQQHVLFFWYLDWSIDRVIGWSVLEERSLGLADENVVAIARSSFTLNCKTTNSSSTGTRWHYSRYGHNTPVGLHNGRKINADFRDRFSVRFDRDRSRSLLQIQEVRLSDAGTYSCSKLKSSSKISIFHVQVLGTRVWLLYYLNSVYLVLTLMCNLTISLHCLVNHAYLPE